MRRAVIAAALAALVAGSMGVGYLVGSEYPAFKAVTVTSNQFELVFRQANVCPNLGYIAPWKVVLSNGESIKALMNPSASAPSASPTNPSTIIFVITSGNYTFSVTPANIFTPTKGTVTVDNHDTTVTLEPFFASCGSTTTG